MKLKENKKCELTSQQLVTIIILIVSFAVIIIFFVLLNIKSSITEESCRNSIAMRGLPLNQYLKINNLKCQTQKICMNMGGNCDNLKDAENIKIDNKEELNPEIIKLMKKCWDITGKGKIPYGAGHYCGICYNVYFDKDLQSKIKEINQMGLYNQIKDLKLPNSDMTYLEYLYEYKDFNLFNQFMKETGLEIKTTNTFSTQISLYVMDYRAGDKSVVIPWSSNWLNHEVECSDFPFLS